MPSTRFTGTEIPAGESAEEVRLRSLWRTMRRIRSAEELVRCLHTIHQKLHEVFAEYGFKEDEVDAFIERYRQVLFLAIGVGYWRAKAILEHQPGTEGMTEDALRSYA